ncbi:uncharacterized protein LOC127768776 [Oryza glaberrima]|uniref:Uncharacterized protein n=1 Tax=Oryza glaberrima TaxID=4538 RepID=I1P8X5_ORYGL|nr:uncharacterized protein LOC127768776 [Oryza glaberrima]
MSARRAAAKCQHEPATPPAPRILNMPRRPAGGGRPSRSAGRAQQQQRMAAPGAVNLGALFEMERRVRGLESAPASPPPYSRAARSQEDAGEQEEKWRFQAEILRAECNFLRMEREVALRKLDRHRGQMEAALKSAVETLVSGRKKIDGRGDVGVAAALDEGIEDLEEMMEDLRAEKESGRRAVSSRRELQRSNGRNFDRQASSLRRRLEKMPPADAEPCVKDIREIALPVAPQSPPPPAEHSDVDDDHSNSPNLSDVEMLRMKMEGMSKGMRERMAEYSRRLEAVAGGDNNNAADDCQSRKCGSRHSRKPSASSQRSWSGGSTNAGASRDTAASHGRSRHTVAPEKHHHHHQQHKIMSEECKMVGSGSCCDCREIVGKIMEQVRTESEQWTEMQDMLEQVRLEMQELQSSRDTWQRRAIASDISLRSLNSQVLEWKHRAQVSEQHVEDLQKKISELESKLHTFKAHFPSPGQPNQEWSEACKMEKPIRSNKAQHPPRPSHEPGGGREKEKHVLICRVKHSPSVAAKRQPFQEIRNISLPRHAPMKR